ncbi:JmjC domain-containing protein [Leifsonia shinshuensis]|uniref:JmjC domain-containing protein n=1 Tax=Leifsonia shinshuensis TaxID=150026 RepID=A0A853CUN4_9MICO|nr:cupin domain-containing protein [Leifsonia shinshuensis]NYJ23141.1 hypothetical protein [Leifsonia shinshuensis]
MTVEIGAALAALASGRVSEQFATGSVPAHDANDLLNPAALGRMLSNPLVRHPQVRVALSGKAVQPAFFIEDRRIGTQTVQDGIDAHSIAQWLTRGATITVDSVEYLSTAVLAICERLTEELGLTASATACVTPPARQGLSPHTDEEDVFVLQTFGSKRWLIDPAQRQDIATAAGFAMNDGLERVTPRVLRPGDMFFMPAGTPHVATATGGLSIHLTFSVERARLHTALHAAVDRLASETPDLRMLQSWDFSPQGLVRYVEPLKTAVTRESRSEQADDRPSPFDDWDGLFHGAGSVRLVSGVEITEAGDGGSFDFGEFSIKASGETAAILRTLRDGRAFPLAKETAAEVTELLFQLIGRRVVTLRDA